MARGGWWRPQLTHHWWSLPEWVTPSRWSRSRPGPSHPTLGWDHHTCWHNTLWRWVPRLTKLCVLLGCPNDRLAKARAPLPHANSVTHTSAQRPPSPAPPSITPESVYLSPAVRTPLVFPSGSCSVCSVNVRVSPLLWGKSHLAPDAWPPHPQPTASWGLWRRGSCQRLLLCSGVLGPCEGDKYLPPVVDKMAWLKRNRKSSHPDIHLKSIQQCMSIISIKLGWGGVERNRRQLCEIQQMVWLGRRKSVQSTHKLPTLSDQLFRTRIVWGSLWKSSLPAWGLVLSSTVQVFIEQINKTSGQQSQV